MTLHALECRDFVDSSFLFFIMYYYFNLVCVCFIPQGLFFFSSFALQLLVILIIIVCCFYLLFLFVVSIWYTNDLAFASSIRLTYSILLFYFNLFFFFFFRASFSSIFSSYPLGDSFFWACPHHLFISFLYIAVYSGIGMTGFVGQRSFE